MSKQSFLFILNLCLNAILSYVTNTKVVGIHFKILITTYKSITDTWQLNTCVNRRPLDPIRYHCGYSVDWFKSYGNCAFIVTEPSDLMGQVTKRRLLKSLNLF